MVDTYEAVAWVTVITILFTSLALQLIIAVVLLPYVRLARRAGIVARRILRKMNCDELIDELLGEDTKPEQKHVVSTAPSAGPENTQGLERKRERLAALAIGGQAKHYLGRSVGADQIDAMEPDEVEKLYNRYEARLGATMTKTLGQAAIQLYATVAGTVLPIPVQNQLALAADLEADPFVSHAVSAAACELYHRYGMFLAPLTAALTTAKHCQFGAGAPGKDTDTTCRDGRGENRDTTGRDADPGDCGAIPYDACGISDADTTHQRP